MYCALIVNIKIATGVCQSHRPRGSRLPIKAVIIAVTEKGARVQTGTSQQRFRVRIFAECLRGSRQHVRFDGAVSAGKFTSLVNNVNISAGAR
jgi:hypothetical protein